MILADMLVSPVVVGPVTAREFLKLGTVVSSDHGSLLPSAPMILVIAAISFANA
jgi:hypothetical protein